MVLIPTVHGNGPYVPVVAVDDRLYVLGPQFATIIEALAEAQAAIEKVRADMRADLPEGWSW